MKDLDFLTEHKKLNFFELHASTLLLCPIFKGVEQTSAMNALIAISKIINRLSGDFKEHFKIIPWDEIQELSKTLVLTEIDFTSKKYTDLINLLETYKSRIDDLAYYKIRRNFPKWIIDCDNTIISKFSVKLVKK